jgi:plasmid replication initiation protein
MRKLIVRLLKIVTKSLEEKPKIILPTEKEPVGELQTEAQIFPSIPAKIKGTKKKPVDKSRNKIVREQTEFVKDPRDIRDVMELMEVPFVSLSKKRTTPIIYESADGLSKIKVSRHSEHYLASIYDWDIILLIVSKLQEIININKDIPPRTLIIPRHELLKEIHRHDGKKQEKDLKASLSRLNSTLIETTICNKEGKYESGFSFLDSWGYTDRKDIKEFRITLSEWLYNITCRNGALLKVDPAYFKITSGIKRFLYRTARKHVGTQNNTWTFTVEKLYRKSGSEQEFKKFKYKLKKSVEDNNIPGYLLEWIEKDGEELVRFINGRKHVQKVLSPPTEKLPA